MKIIFICCLLQLVSFYLYSATPTAKELLSFTPLESKTLIYGNGFEDSNDKTIQLAKGFKFAKGEGNNGNTALRVDRVGDVHTTIDAFIKLPANKIKEGYKYRVVVNVKGKGVKHAFRKVQPTSHRFMETFYKNTKTNSYSLEKSRIVPFAPPPNRDNYKEFSYSFPGLKDANTFLRLALWIDFLGTLWFDDLRVYQEGIDANAFLISPQCATFFGKNTSYRIKINIPDEHKNLFCVTQFIKNNKVICQQVTPVKNKWVKDKFSQSLPVGQASLKITIVDYSLKKKIKTVEKPVTVRAKYNPPVGAVTFDEENKMYVDKKPFFPLGIFYSSLPHQRKEHLERIKNSPFNFIMDYSALSMAVPQDKEKITAIRKGLDQMSQYNIKIVICLTAFYSKNSNYVKKGWAGETTTLNMTKKLVNAIKDHPAVLGYYLTDELSEEQLLLPTQMRQLINHLDPYHPTFTLSNLPSAMPNYIVSGDIFIYDPYPLRSKRGGRKNVANEITSFRDNMHKSGAPCWAATQIFNWGVSRAIYTSNSSKEKLENYIEPTIEDMRSMMLLCILDGVTGLVPWMYPFPWQQKIWDKFIARNMGNYPQNLWDKIKVAATSVKELTPYLITKENKNLTVKVVNTSKGTIRAKLYKNAKGKHALIIVGCSNGQFKGTIIVPNNLKLKSKHNLTTYLGNGKYQFVSKNLDSDVLFEY